MAHSRFIRFRFLLMLASLLVFVSVGIMLPATSFAKSVTHLQSTVPAARSWSFVASPNQGSNYDGLSSVAAVSASDVWAVGDFVTSSGFAQTLIEQWNDSSWSIVASPNQSSYDNELYSVTAVSATDIWAVGAFQSSEFSLDQTLIEHWDGTSWSIVASPNQGSGINGLSAVAAVSATNIWAVGYASSQTLIEHWDGTSWSIVASPNPSQGNNDGLSGVVAGSANNIWAVGAFQGSSKAYHTLIEHWNGNRWSIIGSPNQGSYDNELYSVTASSVSDIWAVGHYSTSSEAYQTLIEHWDGSRWSIVASPNQGSTYVVLYSVTRVSASNVWAVGTYSNSSGILQTLTEHWNGTSWSVVASPNPGTSYNRLYGVAAIPTSSNLWAVGAYSSLSIDQPSTLIEYYG